MEKQDKKSNTSRIIAVVAGGVFFVVAYVATQNLFKPSFDKTLVEVASEMNKTCPMMVDQETRLDNTVALPGKVLQYNYTLINYSKDEVSADTLIKYIKPGIVNTARTSPDMKSFRENSVTMDYNYKDKDGVFILKISVTPDMYAE
jgi:hypothetical protein